MTKHLDRRHFILLYVLFVTLISVLVLGFGSWFIVPISSADISSSVEIDTSEYFEKEFTYDGSEHIPSLTVAGKAVYGDASSLSIVWRTGYYNIASLGDESGAIKSTDHDNGVAAGRHFYKIVDNTTGQTICENHEVVVKKADITVGTISSVTGFVGNTLQWTVKLYAGTTNVASLTPTYVVQVSDYGTNNDGSGKIVSSVSHSNSNNVPAATKTIVKTVPTSTNIEDNIIKNNYQIPEDLKYTLTANILPTCYSTQDTTTYFCNITHAVKTTTSGTIVAMQNFKYGGTTYKATAGTTAGNFKHEITENCEIKTGVILRIPFNADKETGALANYINSTKDSLNTTYRENPTYLKNEVIVKANKTLTNSGKIEISGTISGGNGGNVANSLVHGDHSQIKLESSAKLVCGSFNGARSGNIDCYGFISESSFDNKSEVIVYKGKVVVIFSMSEHRGGTKFSGTYANMKGSPFNRFWIESIANKLTVHGGSSIIGHADLYSNDQHNTTNIKLVGSDNSNLINLDKKGKIVFHYQTTDRVNKINIYGSNSINSLSLSLNNVPLVGSVNLTTDGLLFPLSGYYNITFNPFENGKQARVTVNNDIKLLPGAVVEISPLVIMDAKKIAVYETFHGVENSDTAGTPYQFTDPAQLIVNGSLTLDSLGGKVISNSPGGIINITGSNTVTSSELKSAAFMSSEWTDATFKFAIRLYDAQTSTVEATFTESAKGKYYSISDSVNATGWVNENTEFDLAYSFVGVDSATVVNTNPTKYRLSDAPYELAIPTVEGMKFAGWFTNSECTPESKFVIFNSDTVFMANGGKATIYGKFVPDTYSITFNMDYDESSNVNVNLNQNNRIDIASGVSFNPYSNIELDNLVSVYRNDIYSDRYFEGWYLDADFNNRLDENDGVSSTTTLYSKWIDKYSVSFIIPDDIDWTIETIYLEIGTIFDPYGYDQGYIDLHDDLFYKWYFDGWFDESDNYISRTDGFEINRDTVIYANWLPKFEITLNWGDYGVPNEYKVNAIYLNPDQTLSPYAVYDTSGIDYDTGFKYYFEGWYIDASYSTRLSLDETISYNSNTTTLYLHLLQKVSIKATDLTLSDVSIVCSNHEPVAMEKNKEYWYIPGSELSITYSYGLGADSGSITIGGTKHSGAGTYPYTLNSATTISAKSSISCVTPDTLVTLADGTQKRIDELTFNDQILVWNFFTGEFDVANGSILMNHGYDDVDIINLKFSDGTVVKVINAHGFFAEKENDFVFINESNVNEYIGHSFLKNSGDGFVSVTLEGYEITREYTEVYSILTAEHYNCMLENMFTVTEAEVHAIYLTPYDIGADLKYDEAKMQADIEKYGLYSYEEFAHLLTEAEFNALNLEHFKVAVGKGLITYDEILFLIDLHFGKN